MFDKLLNTLIDSAKTLVNEVKKEMHLDEGQPQPMYVMYAQEKPLSYLGAWEEKLQAAGYVGVIGHSLLGLAFLRKNQDIAGIYGFADVLENDISPFVCEAKTIADLMKTELADADFINGYLRPEDCQQLIARLGAPSDAEVFFPVPYPMMGGDGALGTYQKGDFEVFANILGLMHGVATGDSDTDEGWQDSDAKPVKVALVYKDDDGNLQTESVWTQPTQNGYYRLNNSPFFASNLALNDIVSAENDEGVLYFNDIEKSSGYSTIAIVLLSKNALEKNQTIVTKKLETLGCSWEGSHMDGYFSVNIPPKIDYAKIENYLMAQAEILDYKELCLGQIPNDEGDDEDDEDEIEDTDDTYEGEILAAALESQVNGLMDQGIALAQSGQFKPAMAVFDAAYSLLPSVDAKHPDNDSGGDIEPDDWQIAAWIRLCKGETLWSMGDGVQACDEFRLALLHCPGAVTNARLRLIYGMALYDLADLDAAAEQLIGAYMLEGSELFLNRDPKYIHFLASRCANIEMPHGVGEPPVRYISKPISPTDADDVITPQYTDFLEQLDQCVEDWNFPFLDADDNLFAAARISLFGSKADWALIIELIVYSSHNGDGFEIMCNDIFLYGNKPLQSIGLQDEFGFSRSRNIAENIDDDVDLFDAKGSPHGLNTSVTHFLLNGIKTPVNHYLPAYEAAGIKVEDDQIDGLAFLRLLVTEKREQVFLPLSELQKCIPEGLPLLLQLDEWHHPDVADDELPSQNETFQLLAKVIETGDPAQYQPTKAPNTHWSNWEDR